MSKNDDGSPAFPNSIGVHGMTLRAYFAGQALAGLLASGHFTYPAEKSTEDEPGLVRTRGPVYDDNGEETGKTKVYFVVVEEAAVLARVMMDEMKKAEGGV